MKVETPVFPNVPERISRIGELPYNLWWSWNRDARSLFRRLDYTLWKTTEHNPVEMLQLIEPERLQAWARDPVYLRDYDSVMDRFDRYLASRNTWFNHKYPRSSECRVAYFCAEFAFHVSLPIYSGGLGVLAGDTLKEASDLGIPIVAVGSLYPEGYFRQRVSADGRQEAIYERLRTERTSLLPVHHDDGRRLLVPVPVGDRQIQVAVWRVTVGRVPVYLMDTDIPENEPWDRDLSARLYGGDQQVRLRQEIVLGMGGVRVLRALGYDFSVVHMNEGHAAFAGLELIRESMLSGGSLQEAVEQTRASVTFTTHTPVKAGHDEFPFHMMEEYFRWYWEELGLEREEFLKLGQSPDGNSFSMTVLALRAASACNSVSKKHGEISREMWHFMWPDREVGEVPIVSITNGVHVPTWLSGPLAEAYDKRLGENWLDQHDDPNFWQQIFDFPDEELWAIHLEHKKKLINFIRERVRSRWMESGLSPGQLAALGSLLAPDVLTLGFARRFATYKRAGLLLFDRERLERILMNPYRPVQIIFSGKAHPADEPGKFVMQQVFQACASPEFGGRMAFVEDYEERIAHFLVHGVDVWLNNPQPPKEASGTSGQKAALNGVPNLSVLDGWWWEGYNGENGWAIDDNPHSDDGATAHSLYTLLENEVVPIFYDRDGKDIPRRWVNIMKHAIRSSTAQFSTRRMVKEYVQRMYNLSPRCAEAGERG
jgi:glycogen phosphorylase